MKQPQIEHPEALTKQLTGYLLFLDYPPIDLSSTEIRKKIKSGQTIEQSIPKEVNNYINQNNLYI